MELILTQEFLHKLVLLMVLARKYSDTEEISEEPGRMMQQL
jgi:hypothetical protein